MPSTRRLVFALSVFLLAGGLTPVQAADKPAEVRHLFVAKLLLKRMAMRLSVFISC